MNNTNKIYNHKPLILTKHLIKTDLSDFCVKILKVSRNSLIKKWITKWLIKMTSKCLYKNFSRKKRKLLNQKPKYHRSYLSFKRPWGLKTIFCRLNFRWIGWIRRYTINFYLGRIWKRTKFTSIIKYYKKRLKLWWTI